MSYVQEILEYITAGLPVVSLGLASPAEETNAVASLYGEVAYPKQMKMFCWDSFTGISQVGWPKNEDASQDQTRGVSSKPVDADLGQDPLMGILDWIDQHIPTNDEGEEISCRTLYVLKDVHPYLSGQTIVRDFVRGIKNLAIALKSSKKRIILTGFGADHAVDEELRGLVYPVTQSLPTLEDWREWIPVMTRNLSASFQAAGSELEVSLDDNAIEAICKQAQGLSKDEGYNALRLYGVAHRRVDSGLADQIREFKVRELKRMGVEVMPRPEVEVGGLENIKSWLQSRQGFFWATSKHKRCPSPRGVMILGVSGTGKSLIAKSAGHWWNLPVLKVDLSAMFGSLLGETEQRLAKTLGLIESCSPCIAFFDEFEKAISGATGDYQGDGGVSKRMVGKLLTWMQEYQSKVFVMATVNDLSSIQRSHPELLRKGRFDEIFFVDLPTQVERQDILEKQAASYELDLTPKTIKSLAAESEGFTGAELDQVCKEIATRAYQWDSDEYDQAIANQVALNCCKTLIPMSQSQGQQIAALREYAARFAQPAAKIQVKAQRRGKASQGDDQVDVML